MKTFNNDESLKNELLKDLLRHQELDAFVQGKWLTGEKVEGNGFKGCFYGCTMQTESNAIGKFSEKYSVDLWYCHLTEKLFEGLPKEEALEFPYKSIEIIPLGYDFNRLKSAWFKENLLKQKQWVKDASVLKVLDECASLFNVPFNEISESAARSAAESARSAAWSARSAAESAWSAESAAESAGTSARSAGLYRSGCARESFHENSWDVHQCPNRLYHVSLQ